MKRLILAALLVAANAAAAQQFPPEADSALSRASALASSGDSVAARRLLDSLATRGTPMLLRAEAGYQLSRLASSSAERESILGALVVDHPFSPRLPLALYDLGMLELARNDRERAVTHLSRYLSTSSGDTNRVGASLTLGRLLLERGDLPRGCAVLLVGRSELPETAIEIRAQFDFSASRCDGVDTTTKVAVAPRPPARDTVAAPKRTGAFTVQVAAYDTKPAAERLAATLRGHGLEARVVGTAKPFRVRVGRYATRADAEEASRRIDAVAKSQSIVVVAGPEDR